MEARAARVTHQEASVAAVWREQNVESEGARLRDEPDPDAALERPDLNARSARAEHGVGARQEVRRERVEVEPETSVLELAPPLPEARHAAAQVHRKLQAGQAEVQGGDGERPDFDRFVELEPECPSCDGQAKRHTHVGQKLLVLEGLGR